MMDAVQIAIVVFSCLSIWLFSRKTGVVRRYGYAVGLCGQPFWIYASIEAKQWGILLVSLWFVYCHVAGLINNWKRKG